MSGSVLTARELLLGGPGLDGYAYQADVYCPSCAESIVALLSRRGQLPRTWEEASDSERCPMPIFFGESDYAQHCADCGEYLYGPQGGK